MQIAGRVDLDVILRRLAELRPVFHSEADFQFALAWQVKLNAPDVVTRLETRPAPNVHLDLAFQDLSSGRSTVIEVKYLTRGWAGTVGDESFELKNHGAQDIRAYDVVKDIKRVEGFIAGRPGADGAVIVLTNDSSYWRSPKANDTSNAAAFRLCEGGALTGVRAWGPNTGVGTLKGRKAALDLHGLYKLRWLPYSKLPGSASGSEFRRLVIPVISSEWVTG